LLNFSSSISNLIELIILLSFLTESCITKSLINITLLINLIQIL
jgi:hypothetical protein